jgi:2-(1,2-epoxy-1,2-dihydrophenyl)acetyl-CoA isomerase
MSAMPPVLVEHAGRLATVTLNRPGAFNAFDWDTLDALATKLGELAADDAVRGVVITGAGRAFCAGGDLKQLLAFPEGTQAGFHRLAGRFHASITEMRRMPKPVVAAVNGVAAGGGFSFALAADFRVMARSATLKCAYLSAGLTLDGGGTWTLPRLVGQARALEIAALDAPIAAEQALAWGLATEVVDDGQALAAAQALATRLAETRSMHSFGVTKRLLLASEYNPLETQLEWERAGIAACGAHPDGAEGMTAFAEKRSPTFHG